MEEDKQKNKQVSATVCSNCGTTTTPLWRRAPNGDTICNACGLYLKAKNTLRPPTMKRSKQKQHDQRMDTLQLPVFDAAHAPGGTCPGEGQCNGTGGSPSCTGCPAFNQHQANRHSLICANCRTTTTPLWRRDNEGNTICNACGLYYKLHNVHRPVSMKRTVIKRRKRVIVSDKGLNADGEEDELESSSAEESEQEEDQVKPSTSTSSTHINPASTSSSQLNPSSSSSSHLNPASASSSRLNSPQPASSSSRSNTPVPPIEDYIEPKRLPYQPQQQQPSSSTMTTRLPPPPTTPPLNTSQRFDPLFDYRSPRKETNNSNPYQDLADFDDAMTRLERLRRRVLPQQSQMLSKLTSELEDIVHKAERILDKDDE